MSVDCGQFLRVTRWLATIVSLVLSALLLALMQGKPHQQWLACLSLLPLFLAIRTHRCGRAMVCGAVWGGALSFFCSVTNSSFAVSSPVSFVVVLAVPAAFAGLAARLTATIGFNPLFLGLGWVLVEAALAWAGLAGGLLAGASPDYPLFARLSHLLGYLFVAFLGAWANASLLAIFRRIRVTIPARCQLVHWPGRNCKANHSTRSCPSLPISALWLPRAPPPKLSG